MALTINPRLDGVRALAVSLTIICHFFAHAHPSGLGVPLVILGFDFRGGLLNLGSVGVAIFFVLSAYLLTDNLQSGSYRNLRHYFAARYRRIVPAFFAFTLLFEVSYRIFGKYPYAVDLNPIYVLTSAIFAQPLFLFTQVNSVDILPGTWSLYTEVYFYLLLPLVFFALSRLRQKVNLVLVLIFLTWLIRPHLASHVSWTINASVFAYLDYFLLGILLALYKDFFASLRISFWLGLIMSVGSVVFPLGSSEVFTLRGFGAFLVVASCLGEGRKGILSSRHVVSIGHKSYGLFLSHIFVFWYLSVPFLNAFGIQDFYARFIFGSLLAFCASLFISGLSLKFIEIPIKRASSVALMSFSFFSLVLMVALSLDFGS